MVVWNIARWPAALLFMVATVALLFYFAPDANQPFRWITPGGVVGILLWVLASVAFNLYLSSDFNTYNKTYGSIGTVIILLLYLYISSLTILFGATLNATLVRIKEEVSGEQILDAEPANDKPDIIDEETKNTRENAEAGARRRNTSLIYSAIRRSGRVVEGGTLLRCYTSQRGIEGSNPSSSAV